MLSQAVGVSGGGTAGIAERRNAERVKCPECLTVGSCYLTPSTPASHIKGAYTRWGVVQHRSGFGPDLALVILALVLVVCCVVTVL